MSITVQTMGIYLAVACLGGLVFQKLHIPGGATLGAALSVIMIRQFSSFVIASPVSFTFLVEILIGVLVGTTYNKAMLGQLKSFFPMIALSYFILFSAGLFAAWLVHRYYGMDMASAFLATNPGGLNSIAAMGMQFKGTLALIMTFHFVRLIGIFLTAPLIFHLIGRYMK